MRLSETDALTVRLALHNSSMRLSSITHSPRLAVDSARLACRQLHLDLNGRALFIAENRVRVLGFVACRVGCQAP